MKNEITVSVKCNGTGVTVSVDNMSAHAEREEPIIWQVDPGADVEEVQIDAVGTKWPFTDPLPYTCHKKQPKTARTRKAGWTPGRAQYKIIATCKNSRGQPQVIVLDPEMIVD